MTEKQVLQQLQKLGSSKNVDGMKRFGIVNPKAFGVSAPNIRALAKRIGKDHALALKLWETEFHEARGVAVLIAQPD